MSKAPGVLMNDETSSAFIADGVYVGAGELSCTNSDDGEDVLCGDFRPVNASQIPILTPGCEFDKIWKG
jgi:hypothetical protein